MSKDKDEKKKEMKDAGYASFTRDDINLDDNVNTEAEQIFLQMLDVPKRVQKKVKKGKAQEINDNDFYPTSMDETLQMEYLLDQAEAAVDDPSDSQFMGEIAEMRGILQWSKKRQWRFAYWIAGCVFIMSFYYFYQASKEKEYVTGIKKWTEDVTLQNRQDDLERTRKNIDYYNSRLNNDTIKLTSNQTKEYKKRIKQAENDVKIMQDESWVKYRDMRAKQANSRVWNERWSAIWCLIWVALYIVAVRPYGYMISKRRVELQIYGGLQKALFTVAGAFLGAAAGLKVTEYVTHWTDGSKTRSNDAMAILFLQVMLIAAAVILIFVTARVVIVIATITGFIRNYDLIGIAKKSYSQAKKVIPNKTS